MRRGFTLIELLVVITIILIVSAITLGTVRYAMSHGQVSAAARLLQASLVGARDDAIRSGQPSGIRLIPDPAFPLLHLPNGRLDPNQPLVASRMIPLTTPGNYKEGRISRVDTTTLPPGFMPYPALMVCESMVGSNSELNDPTAWFWNIRIGDQIQINNVGPWYTVVGPMFQTPAQGNAELFVNVGPINTLSPFSQMQGGLSVNPEFLWLVNGRDDNGNGWSDEGFDGVDNNANGQIDELAEWESEAWLDG